MLHISSITVDARPLELNVPSSITVIIDATFSLQVTLIDSDTKEQIQDVYWKVYVDSIYLVTKTVTKCTETFHSVFIWLPYD